jgi:D-alanyl-D-alanine carboxypeptidase (penicillin-binding protein 5/6)
VIFGTTLWLSGFVSGCQICFAERDDRQSKPVFQLTFAGRSAHILYTESRDRIVKMKRGWVAVAALAVLVGLHVSPAEARRKPLHHHHRVARHRHVHHHVGPVYVPAHLAVPPESPPVGPYAAALVVDADTGRVLFTKDADDPRPPASMVKMMVALLAFEALDRGDIHLSDLVPISLAASRTGGSGVMLRYGERLPFEDLLKAMLVASANGASVAIADAIAGSQLAMISRMNERARELGMKETAYRTVNGLPPKRGKGVPDMTSANDLAILARKLLEHPAVFRYSAQPFVPIRNGTLVIRNTNHLVGHMEGADGLKTGYFRQAGFNLTATASRDGLRLIAVVLGCPTLQARFLVAQQLLEWGFAHYSKLKVVEAGQPLSFTVKVAGGATDQLRPVAAGTLSYLVRNDEKQDLHVTFQMPTTVAAPIAKDQEIGEIIVRDQQKILGVIPAVSPVAVTSGPATLNP